MFKRGQTDKQTRHTIQVTTGLLAHTQGSSLQQKELMGHSETLTLKGKYATIESSPLPLQRALLSSVMNRKSGPSTPVPFWKMYDTPFQGTMDSAASDTNHRLLMREVAARQTGCPRSTVSARKLAAALWDMEGGFNPSYIEVTEKSQPRKHPGLSSSTDYRKSRTDSAKQESVNSNNRRLHFEGSFKQPRASKRSPKDLSKSRSQGSPALLKSEVPQPPVVNCTHSSGSHGSTLSSELAKLLNQMWYLEEQHNESSNLVASLSSKLKKKKSRIKELRKEQISYQEDLDMMSKKLSDEKKMWMERAEEAVLAAVKSFKEELETEKKSKVKLKSKHKRLSEEVDEARKTLSKTIQDFEREQKARELMEDVCDELAREIGEDKAQVEELKRMSAKYREEVEQERLMLQMAEVWREERVHMKLAEARFELEEKNTALDKLRSELEAFLRAKRSFDEGNKERGKTCISNSDKSAVSALHAIEHRQGEPQYTIEEPAVEFSYENGKREGIGALEGEDSPDEDLHSIELNRASCSGSQNGLPSSQCSNSNSRAMVNVKHSPKDVALFQVPASGTADLKHSNVSNLGLDRMMSSSGTANVAESITSETQDFNALLSVKQPERAIKDWDLGDQPAVLSCEAFPNISQDNAKDGMGLNAQGRSHVGRTDSPLTSGSEFETNGSMPQAGLGLNKRGRNGTGWDDHLKGSSKGEARAPTHEVLSKLEIYEHPGDHNLESQKMGHLSHSVGQVPVYPPSPTCKWTHSLSAPDLIKSIRTDKQAEKGGEVFRDNSLKARLLEAKLESQQARARKSKMAPVV